MYRCVASGSGGNLNAGDEETAKMNEVKGCSHPTIESARIEVFGRKARQNWCRLH